MNTMGRHHEALEAVDRALDLEPNHAWALGTEGQALRMLDRNGKALDSALELQPNDPASWKPGRTHCWL